MTESRPLLLRGAPLPLLLLSDDAFEAFVYAVLVEISADFGLQMVAGPTRSADDGFDCTARRHDGTFACIQCKRYKDPLQPHSIGLELAKVAINSALDDSDVREHWVVTAGDLSLASLRYQRSRTRDNWVKSAVNAAKTGAFPQGLLSQAHSAQLPTSSVIPNYVNRLAELRIWGSGDLEARIQSKWERLSSTVDRYFQLERLLVEHPRPNFELASYLQQVQKGIKSHWLPRRVGPAALPNNLTPTDMSSPRVVSAVTSTALDQPLDCLIGSSSFGVGVLSARGGEGKSTALRLLATAASTSDLTPSWRLPVFLELARYNGSLDRLIHKELGILFGHWRSLPHQFLLLCDGLNEIAPDDAQKFCAELDEVVSDGRVLAVVSIRPTGLGRPVTLASLTQCAGLLGLSIADLRRLAASHLGEDVADIFLPDFLSLVQGAQLEPSPFILELAASLYEETGQVPASPAELLRRFTESRLLRDRRLAGALGPPTSDVHPSIISKLAAEVAARFAVSPMVFGFEGPESVVVDLIQQAINALPTAAGIFASEGLRLLTHYEYLSARDGWVSFSHDIMGAYLAAGPLARMFDDGELDLSVVHPDAVQLAVAGVRHPDEFIDSVYSISKESACRATHYAPEETGRICARLLAETPKSRYEAARAMALLGTLEAPEAVITLRRWLAEGLPGKYERHMVRRALVRLGDLEETAAVLMEAEGLASFPGSATGEPISLWWSARIPIALGLARQRLRTTKIAETSKLSIDTVAVYGGTPDDITLLEKVLAKAQSVHGFGHAFWALFRLDEELALDRVRQAQEACPRTEAAQLAQLRIHAGDTPDVQVLLSWLIEPAGIDTEEADLLRTAVHEALAAIGPNATFGEDAAALYPAADDDAKYRLWKIAARCELPEMGRHLTSALSNAPDDDFYAAALEFLVAAGGLADDVDFPDAVDGATRRILEQPRGFRTLAGERVVALVRDYNRAKLPEVTAALQRELVEFFDSYYIEDNLLLHGFRNEDDDVDTTLAWQLDAELQCILRGVAQYPGDVNPRVLARFVGVNVITMPKALEEKMATILRGVEPSEIDERVEAISDEMLRVHTLDVVSRISKTEVRKRLWLEAVRQDGLRANVLSPLEASLPRLWDTSLASNLSGLLAIAPAEWWRSEIDVAETLTRWVLPLLRLDDWELLCSAAAAARTVDAREMLSLWCDIAKNSGRHHRAASTAS